MRMLGWILGALFLTDGLMALIGRKDLIRQLNGAVGKRLPSPVERTLRKATDVNDTAFTAMGINNVIAGAGMVLVASLIGLGRRRR